MENFTAVIYGKTLTIIDFTWLNNIVLPAVRPWAEGIFWLFYVFFIVDQTYFLIRGVHLLNGAITSGDGK